MTIFGVGKRVRDVRYGEDLFRAYDECRSDPEDNPVVFDMEGGPDNTTILVKSLDLCEDRTGKRPSAPFDDRWEADLGVYVSQIDRAITALRWELRVSSADGTERYLNWGEVFA